MTDKFDIAIDSASGVVLLTLTGFLTLEEVADFARRQKASYDCLAPVKGHLTLCDISACKIQTNEVVEAFRRLLTDPALRSRRIAFVTGNSPARMQVRRLIDRDSARFFENAADAEAWLHGVEVEQPAPATATAPRRAIGL